MKELLEELLGEAVVTLLVCFLALSLLLVLALAFVWGWGYSPLAAGGVGGAVLVFLAYGGWELLRPAKPGRPGRLARAATATFTVAALFAAYAWTSCNCS
ncbi:hypothetical protein [Streptomyces geranii]|uniref:hypothetical protein n=1 Tax=Streptomyces geranii TaxID=2058923 RepID=UPI000D03E02E|nr:hypothetical protein [Streptomyces geranii]